MVKTKKLKLLVTGAAGFLGYEVSRQLSKGGYRPRLMYRSRGEDCEICKLDADMVLANLREPKSLQKAVNGVDGIIHLGARATFESYETLKPSIMDGSIALMEEGIKAGVRLFVYSSSLLVYSGSASIITADSQPNPAIDYGHIKADTEKRLSEMAATAGICFASLRLPHIYGVRDLYFRQLQAGRLILPGLGKNIYTHLHVYDAAAAIIACAEQNYSGILPFGDQLPSSWASFQKVAQKYYPKSGVLLLPQWLAQLSMVLLSPFQNILPYSGLETPDAVRAYNFNLAVDPDLLWKDLGLKPRYATIYQGIPAAVASGEEGHKDLHIPNF